MSKLSKKSCYLMLVILTILLFAVVMLVPCFSMSGSNLIVAEADTETGTNTETTLSGDGSIDNPYEISSVSDYVYFMATYSTASVKDSTDSEDDSTDSEDDSTDSVVDDVDPMVYAKITANLDFSDVAFVGTEEFNGTLDGGGYTISGIVSDSSMFYDLYGSVSNLVITNSTFSSTNSDGIASISTQNYGAISNVYVDAVINANSLYNVGGIVALNTGTITSTIFAGSINVDVDVDDSYSYIGGIVGNNAGGTVTASISNANISFDSSDNVYVGGIAGYSEKATVSYCLSLGSFMDSNADSYIVETTYVGGLIGENPNDSSTLLYSYFYNDDISYYAVGGTSADVSVSGGNQFRGISGSSLTSSLVNTLFTSNGSASYTKQTATYNGSAYYAPILNKFDSKVEDLVYAACTINLYGIADDAVLTETWGTAENPYTIDSVKMYQQLVSSTAAGYTYSDSYFVQTAVLDFDDISVGTIGNSSYAFAGNYDGGQFKITNLAISESNSDCVGMFGNVTGNISNIVLADSCSFTGNENVGSVAGKISGGTISYAYSNATVTGTSNVGGIIGQAVNAKTATVLYSGQVNASSAPYGIVGATQGFTFTNTWYAVNSSSSCQSTNQNGNMIYYDSNGSLSFCFSDDGDDFEFSASAGSGFSAEYRLLDETVIDDNNDVLASELASIVTAGKNIYVRFVQTVNVATYGSSDSEELGTYYEGQSISIAVPITSGNYFAGIYDGSETAISTTNTYTDSTNTATAVFKWAVGVNTYYTLTKEIDTNIDTNGVSEQYDGTEQSYSYSDSDSDDYKLLKGYSCSATSSGRLINVGDYIITITISDTNGVKCGYATTSYTITPIQLTVTEGMVNLVKEFDNSTAAVATQMLSYPENIVSGDDIVISATLTFDETKISTGLKATINLVLSGTASGNYVFLSGTASGNYVLSATSLSFTTNSAEITKKKIVFEISASELTKVYDGKSGIIYNYGLAYGYSAVSSDFPIKEYIYIHSTDATSTDTTSVGVYDVLITYDPQFITDSYNSSDYYIVDFKIAYTYEITAKEVDVTFTSNQADYNGATQVLSASYTDISGKTVLVESNGDLSLTYYLYNAETAEYEEVYEFINTGEYMVIASLSTNYCLSSTIDAENNINACYFEITKATQPEITFEVTGKYTFGDDAFDLSEFVTASNNDDTTGASIYFEVYSGYGAIVEDTTYLSLIGAGDIVINAIMPESTNYNSGYASYTITVAYQSLVITTEQTTYKISYGSDLSLEFIFEGFEDGEEPTDFVAPSITYYNEDMEAFTDVTKLDVGTYSIVCANDATSAGYSITSDVNIDITLTVVQLEVSVTIDSFSVSYGDTEITEFTYTTAVDSLSNDVDLIITLSRAAGDSVGSYTITAQSTLIADNSNYDISITEGSYTITTRKVTLVMDYMTKVYGETDPDVTYSVDNLVDGDAEPFTVIFSRTTGEDVGFYVYRATITTTNSNYSVSLQSSKLTVTAATPSAVNVKDIEIEYAYELATVTPTATASATYLGSNTTVSGTLSWVDDSQLMLASGTYSAIFVPNSANYSSVDVEVYVTLIARELEVEFSYDDLTYTGTTQTPISYTIKNIREGDTVGDALTYSATVLNIGEYTATVSITNNSYVLVNATLDFEIDAAKLVVYAEDLVSTTAETPVATYVYEGFVGSDSAAVLVVKPTIDFATEIGTYTVTPYGAEAANYSITYKSSQFTLNQAQIASDSTSFVLYGSFDEDNSVAVAEIFSELDANFAAYSAAYDSIKVDTNYSSTSLQNLYSFGLLSAGSSATLVDNCTASIAIPEEISNASNITIVLIMADGSVKYAENVYISSNNIYFDMEDCVAFGIVATPNYTLLYIAIGAGAVIIIALIVVIVTKIKKRKQGHD